MNGRDHRTPLTFSLVLNLGETRPVTYPVRIVLDEGNLANRISEVREWLNKHGLDPAAFQYRMAAEHVELRIDFVTLRDASKFANTFGGLVFGAKRSTPGEVDTLDPEEEPPKAAKRGSAASRAYR